MYSPEPFVAKTSDALDLIHEFPFATCISITDAGAPFVSHIPLIMETSQDGSQSLIGHMSRRNPQWTHFERRPSALAIFHGPQAYVSPRWYVSGRDVPTWNYAVVHVSGRVRLIVDFDGLTEVLKKLTARFENKRPDPWEFELPDDLKAPEALTRSIVGFEIRMEKVTGKFKVSQNRSLDDQEGVSRGLQEEFGEVGLRLEHLMHTIKNKE
ncbi:MAG: FMN-binding negative transcriptional regulator [Bdellovibrionales bacterium]